MSDATFYELSEAGLIAVEGEDAVAFLHAQLTSDVAGLGANKMQYSGYCSPKGRLLATMLLLRSQERVLLQLPLALSEPIRSRLSKYVLRAKVKLQDMRSGWTLFGVSGRDTAADLARITGNDSIAVNGLVSADDVTVVRLSPERYLILAAAVQAPAVRATLEAATREESESAWARLDIEAGIPWIMQATGDEFIPQMVNLDLIGGVSYSKGCYPGQEIVARTHYLGRVKQRMHRIHIDGNDAPAPGEPLYGALFGAEQASGTLLNVAPHALGGYEALAVVQTAASSAGSLHWKVPDGPAVDFLPLPYSLPV